MAARRVVRQTVERGCSGPTKSKEVLQTPSKKPIIWAADHDMTETRLTFRSLLIGPGKCVVRILQALMSETAHRQNSLTQQRITGRPSTPDDVKSCLMLAGKRLRASSLPSPCENGSQFMVFFRLGIRPHGLARPNGHGHRIRASTNRPWRG